MRLAWLLLVCFSSVALATDVYTWVDAEGVRHWSDQASPGAKKVHLDEVPTYRNDTPKTAGAAPKKKLQRPGTAGLNGSPGPANPPNKYRTLEIVTPTAQEVLWNIAGQLPVSLRIEPDLQAGDRVQLLLDNQPLEGLPPTDTQFQLTDVYRGVHTLRAEVRDPDGRIVGSSNPVTFMVKQASTIKPSN
jgi:hypothetical protein